MESEKDGSSGNESEREEKGPGSPQSGSRASMSSNSSNSDDESRNMRNGRPSTPQSGPGGSRTPQSGPRSPNSSPEQNTGERSRPHTPKSPESPYERPQSPYGRPLSPEGSPTLNSGSHSGDLAARTSQNNHHNDDNNSVKSSSQSSRKSNSPDRNSVKSDSSRDSKRARKEANLDDGNTSDSSESSVDSSRRRNKNPPADTQPEEISDGDMESDNDKFNEEKSKQGASGDVNINHDDLSDVSDLDDSMGDSEDEKEKYKEIVSNEDAKSDIEAKKVSEKPSRTGDEGEEQLDFEAEDGECADPDGPKETTKSKFEEGEKMDDETMEDFDDKKDREDLEEGEVSDEDDVRPEETEPRPVCRFFSRGQCTWGASCRFLHPGVTDKGNYTMFEMIRPVVPGEFRDERSAYGRPEPAPLESAWERGLRTAKEMLRKSMKRKEQDIDFEEKKMNLSLAQEEFDKENGYYGRAASPEPRHVIRHAVPAEYGPVRAAPEEYYGRRQVIYEPDFAAAPRERVRTYRELPAHRMPDYYNTKYEEDAIAGNKSRKTKREVIVQRAEESGRTGRGDEWQDPWMRSKSPGARKGRKRSYSSGSSYSTSSSSRSSSRSSRSSYRSRSRSPRRPRSRNSRRRRRQAVSPSIIVNERKAANERAALMNPPAPKKKALSPGMMRLGAQNPPAPSKVDQFGRMRKSELEATRARLKQRSSRSSSDSSGSSSSDSESSDSSSSSSRDGSPRHPTLDAALALKAKAIDALKSGSEKRQIKLNLKNPAGLRKEIGEAVKKLDTSLVKKRLGASPPPGDKNSAANKKATSRREELLKQLKAVEDAIAKKRSKVN